MLTSLLIYFKQKPVLHHAFVLMSVSAVYVLFHFVYIKSKTLPRVFAILSYAVICIICVLGPQFLYQVRPYTFYISGMAIGLSVVLAASINITGGNNFIGFPSNLIIMLLGYLTGSLAPLPIIQIVTIVLLLLIIIQQIFSNERRLVFGMVLSGTYLICMGIYIRFSAPMLFFEEQSAYEDKILFTTGTQFHKLVVTQWHDDHWFFIDQIKNISSIDEYLYYEPMVHSIFSINAKTEKVLVLGGENGCLVREVLKFPAVTEIHVLHYDSILANLGRKNHLFTSMNLGSLNHEKVTLISDDLLEFISGDAATYDAIFIDLPDPRSIETNQFYTLEFYTRLGALLENDGVMITQAGSPYFASEAFYAIGETMSAAGFHALPMHNQILTLGEWGWFVGSFELSPETMKQQITGTKTHAETRWWNGEAAKMVTSFGKSYFDSLSFGINSLENPLIYQYYLKGNWDMN